MGINPNPTKRRYGSQEHQGGTTYPQDNGPSMEHYGKGVMTAHLASTKQRRTSHSVNRPDIPLGMQMIVPVLLSQEA